MAHKGDKINTQTLTEPYLSRYRRGLVTRGLANYLVRYLPVQEEIKRAGI